MMKRFEKRNTETQSEQMLEKLWQENGLTQGCHKLSICKTHNVCKAQ